MTEDIENNEKMKSIEREIYKSQSIIRELQLMDDLVQLVDFQVKYHLIICTCDCSAPRQTNCLAPSCSAKFRLKFDFLLVCFACLLVWSLLICTWLCGENAQAWGEIERARERGRELVARDRSRAREQNKDSSQMFADTSGREPAAPNPPNHSLKHSIHNLRHSMDMTLPRGLCDVVFQILSLATR